MTSTTLITPEILKYAVDAGIIDLGSIRTQYEETERMKLLDSYEYKTLKAAANGIAVSRTEGGSKERTGKM